MAHSKLTAEEIELLQAHPYIIEVTPSKVCLSSFIWKNILGNVIKKLAEYIIEHHEVNEFWGVFIVCCCDIVDDNICYIL